MMFKGITWKLLIYRLETKGESSLCFLHWKQVTNQFYLLIFIFWPHLFPRFSKCLLLSSTLILSILARWFTMRKFYQWLPTACLHIQLLILSLLHITSKKIKVQKCIVHFVFISYLLMPHNVKIFWPFPAIKWLLSEWMQ